MIYKTLMLKIYEPSNTKKRIMDNAISRYAAALQLLLDRYHDNLCELSRSSSPVSRTMLLYMLEKDVLKQLNELEVQPFKDSLKIEFAALAMNFIVQRRKNPKTSYPNVLEEGGAAEKSGIKTHPLYFGRYDTGRDYCLLIDRSTGRYYAKLYLLNAKNKTNMGVGQGKLQLQYIHGNTQEYLRQTEAKRFIILPLAFGKHQLQDLTRLLQNPKLARTARLKKVGDDYYLLLNIACESVSKATVVNTMGIARSAGGGVHYTICDSNGQALETAVISPQTPDCQKLYLLAKAVIAVCRRFHPQVIMESSGGKNDKLLLRREQRAMQLTSREYSQLTKILGYKLAELGLPEPVLLSANRLFATCPACLSANHRSRISSRLFVCVECGYASDIESIGSLNLIKRFHYYKHDRVPFELLRFPNRTVLKNRILGFECTLPPDHDFRTQMIDELERFIHLPLDKKIDSKKYAVLQKMKAARDISQAIRIVEKSAKP